MIVLLDLVVIGILIGISLLFLTQIVLPMFYGTPLFPNFRQDTEMKVKIDSAEYELEEQQELAMLQEQLNEINRRKAELEKKA